MGFIAKREGSLMLLISSLFKECRQVTMLVLIWFMVLASSTDSTLSVMKNKGDGNMLIGRLKARPFVITF